MAFVLENTVVPRPHVTHEYFVFVRYSNSNICHLHLVKSTTTALLHGLSEFALFTPLIEQLMLVELFSDSVGRNNFVLLEMESWFFMMPESQRI